MSVIRCTGDDSTGFLDNHHEKDVSNMTLNSFCPRYTIFIFCKYSEHKYRYACLQTNRIAEGSFTNSRE